MKLRNGKEYFFKQKKSTKEKKEPGYVKDIVDYLKCQFAYAGFELIQIGYSVVRPKKKKTNKNIMEGEEKNKFVDLLID